MPPCLLLFQNEGVNVTHKKILNKSYLVKIISRYEILWCIYVSKSVLAIIHKCMSTQGRGGKGSIFVWANGNGGPSDDCAADGYSTSIYTISTGAVSVTGEQSYYDEECSAKMVSAYVTDDEGYSAVVRCS